MFDRITRRVLLAAGAGGGVMASAGPLAAGPLETTQPIETASGFVRGRRGDGVSTFLGVPYGEDTALCRFQPARAAAAWSGVRDAFVLGPQAPQGVIAMAGNGAPMSFTPFAREVMTAFRAGMEEGHESEACLVLNVFTPDASPARKRPVMVWLHGGGFAMGSAGDPQYDGSALCRRGDVVVVTLNHRLNALGYLYLGELAPEFADSGNVGQLDIVLALEWVRDNISAFGGDPGNVTVFGESGGGKKVSILLAMPVAEGLFHRAIIQSTPDATTTIAKAAAAELAERALAGLGVGKAEVRRLLTMDPRTLIKAASAAERPGERQTLSPVVDGRALPSQPFSPIAPTVSRGVAVIIGTNKDEGTLFLSADPAFATMTEAQAQSRFDSMLGPKGTEALAVYKAMRPNDPPTYWVTALMTDMMMRMDSIRLAERKAAQHTGPVYMYRLDWQTPILHGAMRTPHGLDVPLVFDTVETKRSILGPGPEPERLAAVMSQAWINFARTGDPSPPGLTWPSYDAASRKTMIFDLPSRIQSDPDQPGRQFWKA